MKLTLPTIYPITDRTLTNLSHAEQVERLIRSGAKFIQLREKRAPASEFFYDARRALEIARRHAVKIIINDRVDLALALGADGVHLGQDDLPPEAARRILGPQAIIGYSTHNLEQIVEAVKYPIDYVAIGPVYPTSTKENPDEVIHLEGVRQARRASGNFPLVAIGGINAENFREVFAAGADSLAVIKSLLCPPGQIAENFKVFSQADLRS